MQGVLHCPNTRFLFTFGCLGDCTFHSLHQTDIYGTLQAYHNMSYYAKDRLLRMSDYCFTPHDEFFSYIMPKTSYISMRE